MERIGYESANRLDAVFLALSDPTRRAILLRLTEGEASVKDLGQPFAISQPAVSKHLKMLEAAGLVTRRADRQRRMARLEPDGLRAAVGWLTEFTKFWEGSFDQLDRLLEALQSQEGQRDD